MYRRWLQMRELDVEIAMQVEDEMGKVVLPVFVGLHDPVPPCSLWLCERGLAAAMTTDTDYTQKPIAKSMSAQWLRVWRRTSAFPIPQCISLLSAATETVCIFAS
jgi:hypothetical protein